MNKQEIIKCIENEAADFIVKDTFTRGKINGLRTARNIVAEQLDEPPKEVTCKNYPIPKLDELGINYFNCNSCDFFINFDESNVSDDDFNHCPKCGYKLEGK